ncbi:MAG: ankyrin repeat domain-containing protein [Bacteriovoracales bacterium]|nr:ankyrin repeat domain-containing protein [Bacteriovoracales bacterium]
MKSPNTIKFLTLWILSFSLSWVAKAYVGPVEERRQKVFVSIEADMEMVTGNDFKRARGQKSQAQKKENPLHKAARLGDIKKMAAILNYPLNFRRILPIAWLPPTPDPGDPYGWVIVGDDYGPEKMSFPVRRFEDLDIVNIRDSRGWTALHYAFFYGQEKACDFLMGAGADREAKNRAGQIPVDLQRVHLKTYRSKTEGLKPY